MAHSQASSPVTVSWPKILLLGLVAIGLYGLVPQIAGFSDSLKFLKGASAIWTTVAVLLSLLSYGLAALVYVSLAQQRLLLGRTTIIQLASNFANRLLPAGIGAIAVNYQYLRRSKHSTGQAGAMVLLNNFLGFAGNMFLLVVFAIVLHPSVQVQHHTVSPLWVSLLFGGVVIVLLLVLQRFGKRLHTLFKGLIQALISYRHRPRRVIGALLASLALTLCYTLCLLACTRAVGITMSFGAIFVSMTLGVAGATVTPTPGGLGGAEAALVAAILVYGVGRPQALAAVLLYRLCTFWLPLAVGGLALGYSRRRYYI